GKSFARVCGTPTIRVPHRNYSLVREFRLVVPGCASSYFARSIWSSHAAKVANSDCQHLLMCRETAGSGMAKGSASSDTKKSFPSKRSKIARRTGSEGGERMVECFCLRPRDFSHLRRIDQQHR